MTKLSDYRKQIKSLLDTSDPQEKLAEDFNLGGREAKAVLNSKAFRALSRRLAPSP